jgi:uncharacterized repeat protein (TIGR03803 family)
MALEGCGTVFRIAPNGAEKVLYSFSGGIDGDGPQEGVLADEAGNLYGTTAGGGEVGLGAVFKLAPDGSETVLYSFQGNDDGRVPFGILVADRTGNLYGTTQMGGCPSSCSNGGYGVVFKLAPDGTETILHAFCTTEHCGDGTYPLAGLLIGRGGNLYGTTNSGSGKNGKGTVFRIKN